MRQFLKVCRLISSSVFVALFVGFLVIGVLVLPFVSDIGNWVVGIFFASIVFVFLSSALSDTIGEDCPFCKTERLGAVSQNGSTIVDDLVRRYSYRCNDCGHTWSVDRDRPTIG